MFPHQLTDTLTLDFFKEEDASNLYQLIERNRSFLRRTLPWLDFSKSEADSLAFIKKTTVENHENKALTLCIRDEGEISGVICFHPFDWAERKGGLGYWLDEKKQGRGIITRACDPLIEYGFSELGLSRIQISVGSENKKSANVAERLGFCQKVFIPEKEWLYDHFVDHFCYEMTQEEWASRKKAFCMS